MTAAARAIAPRTVVWLALSQLVCWGISYYLVGAFGDLIGAELGWSRTLVHGGFTVALLAMGVSSAHVGRLIDARGGRVAMTAGSLLTALACLGLAASHEPILYYASWVVMGVAMRLTLYDAAFAALARIGGPAARRPIAQITLLGGLASTVFWPIGFFLADHFGWRGGLIGYAGFALLTIPLHLAIPGGRFEIEPRGSGATAPTHEMRTRFAPAFLYAAIITLTNFLNYGMSAHMIAILSGLGVAAGAAVWIATARGIGQSLARGAEVLFGARLHPLDLTILAALALPFGFAAGFLSGISTAAALVFAFVYGGGNGLLTITRGTLPLALFDPRRYGAQVGALLAPSFLFSAAAPLLYALAIESYGPTAGLWLSLVVAALLVAAAVLLKMTSGIRTRPRSNPRLYP